MKKGPQLERPLLWEAFWDLSTMRSPAMAGLTSIPYDKIRWYAANELQLDDEEADAFLWVIRRVDSHFVNRTNTKAASQSK